MTRPLQIIVVEGNLEEPISRKLLEAVGVDCTGVPLVNKRGQDAFWRDVNDYTAVTELGPVFALVDQERSPDCPADLIAQHLRRERHPDFLLRLAVRTVESWLLADHVELSRYLRISARLIPRDPDAESSPKLTLVNLARRSPVRAVREDLVPEKGSRGVVGKNYTARLSEFVRDCWQPVEAAKRSNSLSRAFAAIRRACAVGSE